MRIERINDNQIRCTLSKNDLIERHLKISELAYGSDKAKELFRDMMEQANIDFGFEADDIPLMIEAIPTSKESIVLVITKVDDPEEFEEKFSKFGNIANKYEDSTDEDYDEDYEDDSEDDYQGDLINCFEQLNEIIENASEPNENGTEFVPLHEILKRGKRGKNTAENKPECTPRRFARLFSFSSLTFIINASKAVNDLYSGKNSVWKDEEMSRYYLILTNNGKDSTFDKVCSIISEFGKKESLTYATQDFFNEHYKLIIKDDAITRLSLL